MKTLYLIRHAKSSWTDHSLSDFDRPLNKRGLRDAPFMAAKVAEHLKGKKATIVTSPANRAQTTARYFATTLGIDEADLNFEPRIYEASPQTLLYIIQGLDKTAETVLLFGHNPAFTYIANYFGGLIQNVPTCGVCVIEFNVDFWDEASDKNAKFIDFLFPKKYQ